MRKTHAGAKIYEVVQPNIMTTDPKQQNLSIRASLEVLESDLHHQFNLQGDCFCGANFNSSNTIF